MSWRIDTWQPLVVDRARRQQYLDAERPLVLAGRWVGHMKAAAGKALCSVDPETALAFGGDLLTDDPADVVCPACIEWMHA